MTHSHTLADATCPISWCTGTSADHGHDPEALDILADDPTTWIHTSECDELVPGLTGQLEQQGSGTPRYCLTPEYHPESEHTAKWTHALAAVFADAATTLRHRADDLRGRAHLRIVDRLAVTPARVADPLGTTKSLPHPLAPCPVPWCTADTSQHRATLAPELLRHESTAVPLYPGMVGYLASWGNETPRYVIEYHYQPMSEASAPELRRLAERLDKSAAELRARAHELAQMERGEQ